LGAGSVAKAAVSSTPGWGLAPACAARTQGLVVSPFAHLEAAEAMFLQVTSGAGGAWLAALRKEIAVTDAAGQCDPSAAIALTWGGLKIMGLDEGALASFSDPFREGMQQKDRRRRLSDDGPLAIAGGSIWGGGEPDVPDAPPVAVHGVLLLYARNACALDVECAKAEAVLAACKVNIPRRIRLSLRLDDRGIAREHFGFADGISQPLPVGPQIRLSSGAAPPDDPWHAVAVGDILLGYPDAHGELAPGPLAPAASGSSGPLAKGNAPEGLVDLGLDGSYLVIRELRQDVARFWASMDAAASVVNDAALSADGVAAKVIGRTRDGAPLAPAAPSLPLAGQPANAFGYFNSDPHGFFCPLGSHIRRANPRDGLSRDAAGAPGLLKFSNNHRILRRGRKFGPDIADPRLDDGQERGLLFMCLNTDIERQFEFVQQNWLLNQTFATLLDETDPLLGPRGPFTLPAQPLRRRAQVETFVRFAGGEYFFLPSLPALDYLQQLR
jgi:Dyp-type peroxidase family